MISPYLANCAVFKVRREGAPGTARPVSQNSTACSGGRSPRQIRVRSTFLGPPAALRRRRAPGLELPRKEVIQPHLPVRLPCYDFTPITSPTFDGSLPEGLGHRLRVLPAFVV